MSEGLKEIFRIFGRSEVLVRGDSKIALNWINKLRFEDRIKISKGSSQEYLASIFELKSAMRLHKAIESEWRGRDYSVTIFGH